MCEWCQKHGDGKKWYLNIKNYSKDLLKDEAVVQAANTYFQNVEPFAGMSVPMNPELLKLKSDEEFSQAVDATKQAISTYLLQKGQVIPIEDAIKVIELSGPVAQVSCVCRRMLRASFDEKTCIMTGPVYLEYAKEWPDHIRNGINYISKEEAIEKIEEFNEKGYVHNVFRDYHSPAMFGICNCEFPTCNAIRSRRYYGDWLNFFLKKSEYVVMHDRDKCTGCGDCVMRCQFSAITYSPYLEKAIFDMKKCAGCGLCRDVCEQKAIKLISREDVPAVRRLW